MKRAPSGLAPLIAIDRAAGKPLHRQIYDAYRAAIVERRLRPGQRIPSTRVLAAELGVSRFPVLNAYAQLLAEGFFEGRIGAGTVVSSALPGLMARAVPVNGSANGSANGVMGGGDRAWVAGVKRGSGKQTTGKQTAGEKTAGRKTGRAASPRPFSRRRSILPLPGTSPWFGGEGAFGVGQVSPEEFPLAVWSKLVARRSRNVDFKSLHYGEPSGLPALRETIAEYLRTARSLQCEAEQVMIVSGSQQALELSARALLDPGTPIWLEEPGYLLAHEVFALAEARIVPVPVDRDGLDVAAGIKLKRNARLAYVTPSHQFPLGHTMSASRRLQLLEWAEEQGAWVLEDDYDSEYRYERPPIASLQGLDTNARVIYIGTFSKVLFPALRMGYLVLPPDLVEPFRTHRRAMDISPPTLYQQVLTDFIGEGHFARHIRRMRSHYRERRSALVENILEELPEGVEVLGSEAGMHLTLTLPAKGRGIQDREIALRAAQQGLWLWPLSTAYIGSGVEPRQGFILGFGNSPVEEIPRAVRKLRNLILNK
jgi:GntR family transcriptional regulator/MocR family aminotransferase